MSEKNTTGATGTAGQNGAGAAGAAGQDSNTAANATKDNKVPLSGGRTAVVRKGKGKDLREAMRRAKMDPAQVQFELLAVLTTIDGQSVFSDEILEMDLEDVTALMGGMGGDAPDFTLKTGTSST